MLKVLSKGFPIIMVLGVLLWALPTFADVTADITAENTFTSATSPKSNPKDNGVGHLTISISGTWVGSVTLQRSFDAGSTWVDVKSYTSNDEESLYDPTAGIQYRIGIKTGNYTSGTASVRLAK